MKINFPRKTGKIVLHLLFWLVSVNAWYFVFNPGVESAGSIKGLSDIWPSLLMVNTLFFLYCLLPLIWLLKKIPKWIKIGCLILFLGPLIYFLVPGLFTSGEHEDVSFFIDYFISGFTYVVVFHLTIIFAVYFNLRILIPRYLGFSRFGPYSLGLVGLIVLTAFLNFGLFDLVIDKIIPELYFISYYRIPELFIIIAAYLLFTTLVYLIWQYTRMLVINREKARNELSALKAQINPHFLFNNLNTIYALASTNEEHAKDVILKLSDFLRYVLYDTSSDSIPLEKEAEIIRTYIDLQKERLDPGITTVLFSSEGDFGKSEIAPLLLLPFVENCFKHGVGKQPGKIQIHIGFDGKRLLFTGENPMAIREPAGKGENGGIGLNNVEKRLNLLYAGRHSLLKEEKDGIFRVELSVDLK